MQSYMGFLALSVFVIWGLMLTFFGTGGTLETIFIFVSGLILGSLILVVAHITQYDPGFKIFGSFQKIEAIYAVVAYGMILATMLWIPSLAPGPGGVGIIVGLGIGAFIIFILYIVTENIFLAIGVHAAYNITALLFAVGVFGSAIPLSASAVHVPTFEFNSAGANNLALQAMMQVFVVASSEEVMKISMAVGISMIFGITNRLVTMGVAGSAWAILHTILSYRV